MSTEKEQDQGRGKQFDQLAEVRQSALNWVLGVILSAGAVILIYSLITEVLLKDRLALPIFYCVLYFILLATVLAKRFPYEFRASVLLAVLFSQSLSQIWMFGVSSIVDMLMLLLIILACMFFGLRVGIGALVLCVMTLITSGILYSNGIIAIVREQQILSTELGDWISVALSLTFMAGAALAVISVILKRLEKSVVDSLQLVDELQYENEERRKAEHYARKNFEQYRLLADNVGDVISVWDFELNCTYMSPSVIRMRGFSPEEIIGRPAADIITPDSLTQAKKLFSEELARDHQDTHNRFRFKTIELEMTHKAGHTVWTEVKASFLRNDAGDPVGILSVARDISERKEADQEKKQLETQLLQSQKMEAVGQLAGGIAHDFNNLLQVILGYGDLSLRKLNREDSVHSSVEKMLEAGKKARTLVGQLLAFSRRQVLEMQDVDLNEVIATLMKMMRRVIGEHISLNIMSGHNLGTVHADRGQIEQILMNLCVNARDAMPDGGSITIETENVRIDDAYCKSHSWAKPGRYVMLSLTDNGCGMDKETMDRVFEPFFTTKEKGRGTGLGLATVYGIVKQHDGFVHVYSEPGHGTTFKIYFPLIERTAGSVGDKIEKPVPGGTETILLAEDDQNVRDLSKTFLEEAGYTVIVTNEGQSAIDAFKANRNRIQLALLDVMMPKVGGRAVYEAIRASGSDVPVLFSSGYSMNAIHTNFVLDEGMQLLQKPFDRPGLLYKVREVLDGANFTQP